MSTVGAAPPYAHVAPLAGGGGGGVGSAAPAQAVTPIPPIPPSSLTVLSSVAPPMTRPHHVALSFAEGDPMLLIYPLLLRLQEKGAPLSLLVPQTVLYEHHFPRAWYAIEPQTESQKQRRVLEEQHQQQQKMLLLQQHHHVGDGGNKSGGHGGDHEKRNLGVEDGGVPSASTNVDDDPHGGNGGAFALGAQLPPSSARRLRGGPPPSTLSGGGSSRGAGATTKNKIATASPDGSGGGGGPPRSNTTNTAKHLQLSPAPVKSQPVTAHTGAPTGVPANTSTDRGQDIPLQQQQQRNRQIRRDSDAGGAAEARLLLNAGSTTSTSAVGRLEQEREWASALTITRRGGRSCDATSVKQHFVAPVDAYFVAAFKSAQCGGVTGGGGGGGGSLLSVDPRVVEAARQYLARSGIAALLGSVDPLVPRRRHVVHSIDNVQSWFDVHHFSTTAAATAKIKNSTIAITHNTSTSHSGVDGLNDDMSVSGGGSGSPGARLTSPKRRACAPAHAGGSSSPPNAQRHSNSSSRHAEEGDGHGQRHQHSSAGTTRPGSAALRYHFLPDLIGDPPAAVARQHRHAHDALSSVSQAESSVAHHPHKSAAPAPSVSLLPLLCGGPTGAAVTAAATGSVEVVSSGAAMLSVPDEYIGCLLAMLCGGVGARGATVDLHSPTSPSAGGAGEPASGHRGGGMVASGSGSGGVFTGSYGPGDMMITALGHSGVERMLMHTPDTAVLTRYDLDNFGNDDSYDFFTNNNHAASTAQRHRDEQRKLKARDGGSNTGAGGGLTSPSASSPARGKQKSQPAAAAAATSAALAAGLRRHHEVVVAVWTPQCFSVELRVANAALYDTTVPVAVRADTHTLTHYREAPACAFMTNQIRDALTRFAAAVERYEGKRVLLFRGFFRLDACQRPWLIFCDDLQVAPAPLVAAAAAAAASASAAGTKGAGAGGNATAATTEGSANAALSPISGEQHKQHRTRGGAAAAGDGSATGQALPPLVQIKTDQIRTFEREEQRRLAEIKRLKEQQRLNPLLGGTSSLFGSLGASSNATAATIAALASESQRQRKKHCTGTQQPLSMFDPQHIYAQYHEELRAARDAAAANRKQRNNSRHNSTAVDRDGARGSVAAGLEDESTARGVHDDASPQHTQRRSLGYSVVSEAASYAIAGTTGGGEYDVSAGGAGSVGYFSPPNDHHRQRPSGATGGIEEENPQLVALRQTVSGMLPLSPPAPQRRNRLLTAMLASSADRAQDSGRGGGGNDPDGSSLTSGTVHRKPLYAPGTRDYYHVPRAAQLQLLSRVLAEEEAEAQQQEGGVGENPRKVLMLAESKENGPSMSGENTLAAQTQQQQQQQEDAASSASPPMSPGTPPRTQQHTRRATVALLAPEDTPAALLAALSHPAALPTTATPAPSNTTAAAAASPSAGMVHRGGSIMAPRPLPATSGSNSRGSGSDGLPAPLTIAAMRGRVAAYARWIGEDAADDTAAAASTKQLSGSTANTKNTSTTANTNHNAGNAASPPAGVLKRSPSVDSNGQPLWTPQDRRRQLLRRLRRQLPQALVDHPDITDALLLNVEDEVNHVISGGSTSTASAATGGGGSNTKTQQLQFRRRIQQYLEREETLRRKRQRALHPPLPLLRQSPKDIRCIVHFTGADLLLEAAGSSPSATSQSQQPPLWCHVPDNWLALSHTLRERIAMMTGAAADQKGRASTSTGGGLPHARRRIACESFEAAVSLQERLYTDHAAEYIIVFNKGASSLSSTASSTCQHQTVDAAMPGYFYWYPPQCHEVLRARYLKLTARRRDLQRAYHVELRRRQQQEAARWGGAGGGGRRRRSSIGASFMRSTRSTETRAARRASGVGVSEGSLAGLGGAVEDEAGRRPDSAGSTQGRLSRAESFATSDKDSAEPAAPASPAASFTGKHVLVDSPHGGSVASEGTAGASRRLSGSLSRVGSASGRGASAAAVGMPPIDAYMANLARQQMLEQLLPPGTTTPSKTSTTASSKHTEDLVSTTNRVLHRDDHQADPEAAAGSSPPRPSNTMAPAPHYLFADHTADYCYQGNFYRSDMRDYHYAVTASSEAALYSGGGTGGAGSGSSRPASPQATSRGGVVVSSAAATTATTDANPQALSRHGSLMQQQGHPQGASSTTTVVVNDYRYYYHDFMLKNGGLQTELAMHYYDRVVIPHADAAREAVIAAAERDSTSTRRGQQQHLSHSRLSHSSEAPMSSGPAAAGAPQASTVPLTKRTYSLFYAKKESSGGAGDDDDMDDLDGGGIDGNFSFSPGGGDGDGGSGEGYLRKVNPFQLYMANFAEPDVYTLMPAATAPPPSPRLPHCQAEDRALPNLELFGSVDPHTDVALSAAGGDDVGRGRLLFLPTFNNNGAAKMGSPSDGSGTSRPDAFLAQVIAVEDLNQRAQQTKFTLPPPLRPPVLVPSTPLTAHEEMLLKVELLVRLGLAPKASLVTYYERVRQRREKSLEGADDDDNDDRNSDHASANNTKEFAILKEIVEKSALLTSRLADAVMFPPIEELRPLLDNPNRVDPNEGDPRKHPDKSNKNNNTSTTTKKTDSTTTSRSSGAHPHASSPQDPRRFLQAQREKKLREAMGKNVKHVGVSFERRRNKKEKEDKAIIGKQPRRQTGDADDPLQQQERPAASRTTAPKQKVLSTIAMLLLSERGKKAGLRKSDPTSTAHNTGGAISPLTDEGGGARRAERRRRRSRNSSRDDGDRSSDIESSNSSSGTDLMRQLVYDNTASDRALVYGTSTVSTARDAVSGSGRQHVSKTSQHRLNHTTVINAFVSNAAERRSRSFARRATATNIALTLHEGEQGTLETDGDGGVSGGGGGGGGDASITDFNMSAIPFESTMTFDPLHLSSSAGGTATPPTLLTPDVSGAHIQPDAGRGDDAGPSTSSRAMMQRKRSVVIEGGQRRTAALKVKTVRERMREHIFNVGSTPGFNINNVSCSSSDGDENDHAHDDPFQKGSASPALTSPSPGGLPLGGGGAVGFTFNSRRPTSGSIASNGTHDDTHHLAAAAGGGGPDPAEASCTTPRRAARRQKSTVFLLPPEASESAGVSGGGGGGGGADSAGDTSGKEGGDDGVVANGETAPTNPSRQTSATRRRSSMKLTGSSAALRRRSSVAASVSFARSGSLSVSAADTATAQGVLDLETIFVDRGLVAPMPVCLAAVTSDRSSRSAASGAPLVSPLLPTFAATSPPLSPMSEGGLPSSPATIGGPSSPQQQQQRTPSKAQLVAHRGGPPTGVTMHAALRAAYNEALGGAAATATTAPSSAEIAEFDAQRNNPHYKMTRSNVILNPKYAAVVRALDVDDRVELETMLARHAQLFAEIDDMEYSVFSKALVCDEGLALYVEPPVAPAAKTGPPNSSKRTKDPKGQRTEGPRSTPLSEASKTSPRSIRRKGGAPQTQESAFFHPTSSDDDRSGRSSSSEGAPSKHRASSGGHHHAVSAAVSAVTAPPAPRRVYLLHFPHRLYMPTDEQLHACGFLVPHALYTAPAGGGGVGAGSTFGGGTAAPSPSSAGGHVTARGSSAGSGPSSNRLAEPTAVDEDYGQNTALSVLMGMSLARGPAHTTTTSGKTGEPHTAGLPSPATAASLRAAVPQEVLREVTRFGCFALPVASALSTASSHVRQGSASASPDRGAEAAVGHGAGSSSLHAATRVSIATEAFRRLRRCIRRRMDEIELDFLVGGR